MEDDNLVVAYYRVSTRAQGDRGFGLDAQAKIVREFCQQTGRKIFSEYSEVQSGARADRKILRQAIEEVERIKGTLMVAKLDRLTRNLDHLREIMRSKTRFTAIDYQSSDKFVLSMIGLVAEKEREMIATRIKDALAVKRDLGHKLGRQPGGRETDEAVMEKLREKNIQRHQEDLVKIKPILIKYKNESLDQLRERFRDAGIKSKKGCVPSISSIKRYRKELNIHENIVKNEQTVKFEEDEKNKMLEKLKDMYSTEELKILLDKLCKK